MEIALILCCIVILGLLGGLFYLLRRREQSPKNTETMEDMLARWEALQQQLAFLEKSQAQQNQLVLQQMTRQSEGLVQGFSVLSGELRASQETQQKHTQTVLRQLQQEMQASRQETLTALERIRQTNTEQLQRLRQENQTQLDTINQTVHEKLQKTLEDRITHAFESVNQRLAEVYAGLGEMRQVAAGVTDLKKVLSNVKTRGILGEVQLGAILGELLAPEQYAEQVAVSPQRSERVDFAVKLPGAGTGETVWLPIDAKFPGETYRQLQQAYETGSSEEIKTCQHALATEIKRCANSIRQKYVCPPDTTDFAILFLPFEGLYAEVVHLGLMETLQRQYQISVAGPSTMAALLNSLQMGFRTLAIQRKSGDVWKILESVKKEFATFSSVLDATRKRLRQADEELEKLVGTRTRAMCRKLADVSVLNLPDHSSEFDEDMSNHVS